MSRILIYTITPFSFSIENKKEVRTRAGAWWDSSYLCCLDTRTAVVMIGALCHCQHRFFNNEIIFLQYNIFGWSHQGNSPVTISLKAKVMFVHHDACISLFPPVCAPRVADMPEFNSILYTPSNNLHWKWKKNNSWQDWRKKNQCWCELTDTSWFIIGNKLISEKIPPLYCSSLLVASIPQPIGPRA